jgi:hypothetical protein
MIIAQVYTSFFLRDIDTKDKLLCVEMFHTITVIILEFISLDRNFTLPERTRVEVIRKSRLTKVIKITVLVELRNEYRLGTIRLFVEEDLWRL